MHIKLVAIAVVALALLAASPGGAAIASGAVTETEVVERSGCFPFGPAEFCFEMRTVIHTTTTPSGNTSYSYNLRQTLTFSQNGVVVAQASNTEQGHELTRDGLLQELSAAARGTIIGAGQTCTFSTHVHKANGQVQFDREEYVCS